MTDLAAKYRLQRALSWNAIARTFAGRSPGTGENVAVKIISLAGDPQRDSLTRRFEGTASVLQSLGHPTLPEVVDYGVTDSGEAFLVTTWFPGALLSDLALEPGDVLHVLMQVVEALESLALHGLVHLGISPDNMLVLPDRRTQLTGWGSSLLSVDWQAAQGAVLTVPNEYSAPELVGAGGVGDALWRADLFSIAAMSVGLLGAEAIGSPDGMQVRFSGELSRRISSPEPLRATLQACLCRDPDQRPDAYSSLARALQHSMPRERVPDATATQPMPPLRGGGRALSADRSLAGSVTDQTILSPQPIFASESKLREERQERKSEPLGSSSALTPEAPPVRARQEAASVPAAEPASTKSRTKSSTATETGVHAIRQETGAFVLPKSSSEESVGKPPKPLFEADELGRMIEDLADEHLLDRSGEKDEASGAQGTVESSSPNAETAPSDAGNADEPEADSASDAPTDVPTDAENADVDAEPEEEHTTAEIAVPVAGDGEVQSVAAGAGDSSGAQHQNTSEAEAETRLVSPEALVEMVANAKSLEAEPFSESGRRDAAAGTDQDDPIRVPPLPKKPPVLPVLPEAAGGDHSLDTAKPAEDVAAQVQTNEADPPLDFDQSGARIVGKQGSPRVAEEADLVTGSDGDEETGDEETKEQAKRREAREAAEWFAAMRAERARDSIARTASAAAEEASSSHRSSPVQQQPPVGVASGLPPTAKRWSPLRIGLAAGVLVAMVLAASWGVAVFGRDEKQPAPAPVPKVIEVPAMPAPEPSPLPQELEQAMVLIEDGSWEEARTLLDTYAEAAGLTEVAGEDQPLEQLGQEGEELQSTGIPNLSGAEEAAQVSERLRNTEALRAARAALELGYGADIKARLEPALRDLDVNEIRRALRGGSTALDALSGQPDGPALAQRSRRVLRTVDSFRSALDRGKGVEPLRRAVELQKMYPRLAKRFDALNRAGNRVEQATLDMVDQGKLGDATLMIHEIEKLVDLSPRMVALRQQVAGRLESRAQISEILDDAEGFGRAGQPHKGIDLLDSTTVGDEDRQRFAALRRQLQGQLKELDQQPPQIDLIGEGLDLKRGQPFTVEMIVVDDYEVTSVEFRLTAEGRMEQEIPLEKQAGDRYIAQIPAAVHQGKPVRFWAVASDRSGHRGLLGSQEEPIEVRRKRWFQVFRRRGGETGSEGGT